MSLPPPPPPPPPAVTGRIINSPPMGGLPPSPPPLKINCVTVSLKSDNRDKLFDDIKKGKKLKKCVTIDKSAPTFTRSSSNELSNDESNQTPCNGTTKAVNTALQDELKNTLKRRKEGNGPIAKVPETPFVKRMQLANKALKIMKQLETNDKTQPDIMEPQMNGKHEIYQEPIKKIDANEQNTQQSLKIDIPKIETEPKILKSPVLSLEKKTSAKSKPLEDWIKTEKTPISPKEETQKLDKSRFETFENIEKESKSNLPPRKPMQQNNLKNPASSPKITEKTKIFEVNEESNIKIKCATMPKTVKPSEAATIEPCKIKKITESESFKVFSKNSNEKENGKFISHGKPNFIINRKTNFSKDTTDGLTYKSKMSVSFSRDMQDSPNKFPDVVKTVKQNVIKSDLIVDNINLRDIKIDIDNSFTVIKSSSAS